MDPRICVIGAGPSGITTAKNLLEHGLSQVVVLEQSSELGGLWVFREDPETASVSENTHLVSSKRMSAFEDYPMPAAYPDYPSHRQMADYFQAYARDFGVLDHICFNTVVTEVVPAPEGDWRVRYSDRSGSHQAQFDYVFVCNGHHWQPRQPVISGRFDGTMLHAKAYRRAAPFANQRVLVVGGGNSACDIAVDLARVAAHTSISLRRGYYILPKFLFGQPFDEFAARFSWLPRRLRQSILALALRFALGSYQRYNLPQPSCLPLESHPTLNSQLLELIRHGLITPRPEIQHVSGRQVHFQDNSFSNFDTIIWATGYRIAFPFLERALIDFTDTVELPLYLKMMHPDFPTLYFIGLCQSQGSIWPLADYQARLAAREICGTWKRPPDLRQLIAARLRHPPFRFERTPRHALEVDFHHFRNELLNELRRGS